MLDNFLKYLAMFISLIITTYVVYYVFIIGDPQSLFEWLTTIVIFFSIFVIFLWLKYFEETSDTKLKAKRVVTVFKSVGLLLLLAFIFVFGVVAFYEYLFNIPRGFAGLIGSLQGMLSLSGIFAGKEIELKGKARILIGLIGNGLFLYLIMAFEPFRATLGITEPFSIIQYILFLIIGSLIILGGFFYGHFAKKENVIIRSFNQIS